MRKLLPHPVTIGILTLMIFLPVGCMKDKIRHTYTLNIPVYETLSAMRANMISAPALALKNIGKIYVRGNYIFLNELDKGIHVIDNSNPSHPRNMSFINIPGNEDMAIKGNTLYADAYADLVAFDISDPAHVAVRKILDSTFTDRLYYYYSPSKNLDYNYASENPDSVYIVIGWTQKDTTVDFNPNPDPPMYYDNCPNCAVFLQASNAPIPAASNGSGGSMARFTAVNNYLYTVSSSNLNVFDISKTDDPVFASQTPLGWNVETIYPFQDKLFIGSSSGVYMFDLQSTPDHPLATGEFSHARACDPVIADDKYAYITLSDGTKCMGYQDELDIIDLNDLASYHQPVKIYPMTHPQGLSKQGSTLFICDGTDGLKVYDASDATSIRLIGHVTGPETYDVIAANGLAIVVAKDGLYEYDYSDLDHIRPLGRLLTD